MIKNNKSENQKISDSLIEKEQNEEEKSEVEELNKKILELEAKNTEQDDKILRSLAEIENLRKRSIQDIEKAANYSISKFASDLVLVVENFYLAIENMPKDEIEKSETLKNFATGVSMTKDELVKVLENNNIERINPIGKIFDHNFHQAISQSEEGGESGLVKKVIQAGYKIKDRLIRPALVEVFK